MTIKKYQTYTPIDSDETLHMRISSLHIAINRLVQSETQMQTMIKDLLAQNEALREECQRLQAELEGLGLTFDTLTTTQRRKPQRGM